LVSSLLFEPLTRVDPVTALPRPGLARRWLADPTQTRFTFFLQPSARFTDGTPVTSADVVATLERVRAPATSSVFAGLLARVQGITAPDAHTVVITLKQPLSVLPSVLAQPGLGIMPRALLATPDRIGSAPVGSGPYRFVRQVGTTIDLAAVRPRGARANTPPWVDRVRVVEYPSASAAYAAFRARQLDVAPLGRAESEDVDRRHGRLVAGPYLAVSYYALNLRDPKFADARFREAILDAIDASSLVQAGYGSTAQVASGLIPSGVPGGPTVSCRTRCDYDPAAARRLLAEVFPNGQVPTVSIDYDDDPIQRALAAGAIRQLAAVGIPATARPHAVDQYGAFLASGDAEMFRLGWVADFPSAETFLSPLFVSGTPDNVTGVKSQAFADALAAAEREPDSTRRIADFTRAEAAVLDQFAVAPVVQFETRVAVSTPVHDLHLDPFGAFDATAAWLSPAKSATT
ncbi:MAG: ABC transporter substrate-binding protein, partial [Actinobacteria bacterium]|nr:ABC transporter substrate-binding protein [Actinomycetota bacterium]